MKMFGVLMMLWLTTAQVEACECGGHYVWSYSYVQYVYRCYRDCGTRVYSYERRYEDEHCKAERREVGDQHLTEDGAKKAANDAWSGAIRFHHGEKFMDLTNARNVVYVCSRSSIKETGTLGQTLTRCEISARPCSAPFQRDDK